MYGEKVGREGISANLTESGADISSNAACATNFGLIARYR